MSSEAMGLVSTLESTIRMTPGIFFSLQVHCDPFWGEGGREGGMGGGGINSLSYNVITF